MVPQKDPLRHPLTACLCWPPSTAGKCCLHASSSRPDPALPPVSSKSNSKRFARIMAVCGRNRMPFPLCDSSVSSLVFLFLFPSLPFPLQALMPVISVGTTPVWPVWPAWFALGKPGAAGRVIHSLRVCAVLILLHGRHPSSLLLPLSAPATKTKTAAHRSRLGPSTRMRSAAMTLSPRLPTLHRKTLSKLSAARPPCPPIPVSYTRNLPPSSCLACHPAVVLLSRSNFFTLNSLLPTSNSLSP